MARKTRMNRLTTPELLDQVNPDNIALRDDFLSYLQATQKSEGTIKQYKSDLNIFFVWMLQHAKNKPFNKLLKKDVIAYQNWLIQENGNSSARVRRLKAAISSLSNYCENILEGDDPDYDGYRPIVRKIANPPLVPVREKTVWTEEELDGILDKLVEKKKYDVACCAALEIYGGRRKSEVARFRVSDFDDDKLACEGALYKSAPLLTKGGKLLECYTLVKKFKPYFDLWMAERERLGIESEWLFPDRSDNTKQVSNASLNSWARTIDGLTEKNFYHHSLRHYFVSALSRAGIPDSVIVTIIGWSDPSMFQVYNDNPKDDQIGMYFKNGDICVPERGDFNEI